MKVGILGGGHWGQALARLVLAAGHAPLIAYRDECPPHVLPSSDDPPAVSRSCDLLLVATSADQVRGAIRLARPGPANRIVVAGRGLDPSTGRWLTTAVLESCDALRVGALAGPAPVDEMLAGGLGSGVVASEFQEVRSMTVKALHSPRYRCYESPDLIGVELAGAVVPVLATIMGLAQSLRGAGVGMHGMVLSRGLAELTRIGDAFGADPRTFIGLAGVGDLIAAQARPGHPHFDEGKRLAGGRGSGSPTTQRLVRAVREVARSVSVDVPILDALVSVYDGTPAIDAVTLLMRRESTAEYE